MEEDVIVELSAALERMDAKLLYDLFLLLAIVDFWLIGFANVDVVELLAGKILVKVVVVC